MEKWTRESAIATYNISQWGDGYIDVSEDGDVLILPDGKYSKKGISLAGLAQQFQEYGLALPVLVRFRNILHNRINALCQAFNEAGTDLGYTGRFTAVYPIKVNQQKRVVEEIISAQPAASNGQVGLEAGSKPELIAVLAMNPKGCKIVCNGYKDREFIRLALIGQLMGHTVYIVVEKLTELDLIIEEAQKMGVKPTIGIRARLCSIGKGNWQNTGGDKSKFGLSSSQILTVINRLRSLDSLDCLQLLHFHLGSQIANIRDIQSGLRECARFFVELSTLGATIKVVDVGGGLGVDYEGTRSRSACSVNYSMREYAYHVLRTFKEACELVDLPHPNVITESGRAMTAHHAVLISDIIDRECATVSPELPPPDSEAPTVLRDLWADYAALTDQKSQRSLMEIYQDASYALQESQSMFIHGVLSLTERATADQIYQAVCQIIRSRLDLRLRPHREVHDELNEKLADKVFVNFSLFQSLPDIWGIDQIFPILPLTGLDKPPTRRGIIQDITCDSDGRVDMYVDSSGVEATLPMPEFEPGKPQLLGFFLTGAYQEILGDLHNLFGDTDAIDVFLNEHGDPILEHPQTGDTVDKVLRYVNYEPELLLRSFRSKMASANVPDTQRKGYLDELAAGLTGYTYLEE
ncbi:MAG: biosynthetic arginine decarboxylase [Hahellaceae bacterium]|nr:biosynthetic arginine decarboxylase [Hahellaceae bacterium]